MGLVSSRRVSCLELHRIDYLDPLHQAYRHDRVCGIRVAQI